MLKLYEIIKATDGKVIKGEEKEILNYTISSNEIAEQCMFIPLKGEKTDGHKYIVQAVEDKCVAFLINEDYENKNEVIEEAIKINKEIIIIEVKDTLIALKNLGRYIRVKNLKTPVICVTGSVGKTSTREMIYSVIKQKFNILKTIKNYNSNIGIPLMLLKYSGEEIMLLEAGMDGKGQLEEISGIIKPDLGIITNIGTAHIGILGSKEAIFDAKMEIVKGMDADKKLIINADDEYLNKITREPLIKTTLKDITNIEMVEGKTEFDYYINDKYEHFVINEPGKHQIYNAMIAIKVGILYGVEIEKIKTGISEYRNFEKRMQKYNLKNNVLIIDDSYNASLISMQYGLEIVDTFKYNRKVVVLGDMLELGEHSKKIHEQLAEEIKKYKYDKIYLYGNEMKYANDKLKDLKNVIYTNDVEKLISNIKKEVMKDTLIYFKASNGMKLGRIIDEIKK